MYLAPLFDNKVNNNKTTMVLGLLMEVSKFIFTALYLPSHYIREKTTGKIVNSDFISNLS